ncbi:reverse transcriptase domain-containing protein, partial [Tanacetum coccineum]
MPFGLKNAGATYQRLVDKAFDSQVGRNMEVYVDNLVIKIHTEAEMLRDIDETFRTRGTSLQAVKAAFVGATPVSSTQTKGGIDYGPELNYTPMEKLVLSLVFAAKRLRRYFQAHPFVVIIDQPITEMKCHARRTHHHVPPTDVCERTNPSRFPDGSSAGLILTSPEGAEFTYALRFQFTASNNEAEYEALIAGLRIAAQMGVRNVH